MLRPQGGAFNIREDTDVLGNTAGLSQTGAFSIREDTEVLGNITRNTTAGFGIREDTDVLNMTNSTGTLLVSCLPVVVSRLKTAFLGPLPVVRVSGSNDCLLGPNQQGSNLPHTSLDKL